ncbi:15-hydroxyprostaglandin dehydrogenase [Amniculicola lignicola CBS 123094]|uniref:15-hydroxyprostaglandin dehydrogenase n=1 Tax=Amniculicola lignicola CBS 123094 TaxID=1392246 RepID=A0A6A5WGF9_9PLEO|nr:15-hydroxyprostaglandin dehydrogenase [Amniculicola lignicola CBS 123094]
MSQPVAIVTGAASGIGLAIATHLHSLSYRVVIADLNPTTGLAAAHSLDPSSKSATFIQCDVSSYRAQALLFKQAFDWGGGRLDFCHANAGVDDRQLLYDGEEKEELDEEGLVKRLNTKTMEVNLEAVIQGLWLFKYYVRRSKGAGAGKGKFVATSSSAGLYFMTTNPQYTASKYGVIGLVRSSGPVFVKENITVNCICPGFIPTNLCPPEILKIWPKEHITPVSTAVKAIDAFLGDDQMTGQVVELSLGELYFRQMVPWANESQEWIGTKSLDIWEKAYAEVPVKNGYGSGEGEVNAESEVNGKIEKED